MTCFTLLFLCSCFLHLFQCTKEENFRHYDHRACWFSVHTHLLLQYLYIYIYIYIYIYSLTSCSRSIIIISLIFCRIYFVIVITFVFRIINFIFISFKKNPQFPLNFCIQRSSHIAYCLSYHELLFCDLYANNVK